MYSTFLLKVFNLEFVMIKIFIFNNSLNYMFTFLLNIFNMYLC